MGKRNIKQSSRDALPNRNQFRSIKLKLKGPDYHSELQAVEALMAMSAQDQSSSNTSPQPIGDLAIRMTEEEFTVLAMQAGIEDVIRDNVCKICYNVFSGPLGIAMHVCPGMKRPTYTCQICGEDKWKTKANLHSHMKWCAKKLSNGSETEVSS